MTPEQKTKINALVDAGHTSQFIADQLELNRNTVKSYIHKYKLLKDLPPKVKEYKGVIQGRMQLELHEYIQNHPMATRREIIHDLDLQVSEMTITNYFKHRHIVRKKARRGPLISAKNRVLRVEFAKKWLKRSDEEMKNIVWSDETVVKAFPNGEITMYWDDEWAPERYDLVSPEIQQGGISLQFWGCMSFAHFGPLVQFDGWVDAKSYLEVILRPHVLPEMKTNPALIFQQDNAKPHKGKKVMDWLAKQKFKHINWPPQSPDLSPIEMIWNIMKMKLKSLKPRPRNKEDMSAAFFKIWLELGDDIRMKVCNSFREKLKKCLEVKGNVIFNHRRKGAPRRDCHTDYDSDSSTDSTYAE
jgi:transposase